MTPQPPTRTAAAANQARRRRTEDKLRALADVLQRMHKDKIPVTYPAVAIRTGVSRTFLYDNPTARGLVTAAAARGEHRGRHEQADRDTQAHASLRERALNAEDALKTAYTEIHTQRTRIAELLGQLRDTEQDSTHDNHRADHLGEPHPQAAGPPTRRQQPFPGRAPSRSPCQQPLPRQTPRRPRSPAPRPRSRSPRTDAPGQMSGRRTLPAPRRATQVTPRVRAWARASACSAERTNLT